MNGVVRIIAPSSTNGPSPTPYPGVSTTLTKLQTHSQISPTSYIAGQNGQYPERRTVPEL